MKNQKNIVQVRAIQTSLFFVLERRVDFNFTEGFYRKKYKLFHVKYRNLNL
jgi:hypothetical protein